jgi:arylsulfatase A-like enzyme/tetratricopeptide (TPR) repeat protein
VAPRPREYRAFFVPARPLRGSYTGDLSYDLRMVRRTVLASFVGLAALSFLSCAREAPPPAVEAATVRPSILLVTLDTTRADSLGFENDEVETPALDALAARGTRFSGAWSTAPMTLPSHASMLTGLYPSQHGIHENSRFLDERHTLLAERLGAAGYTSAAFISGYPLKRQFGLARGFDHYDDDLGGGNAERDAGATTERALSFLQSAPREPLFIWVHYFDPHDPYEPPEPYRSRYPTAPYLGEIAFMDQEVGRLVEAFDGRGAEGGSRILVVGDHGEGLGDHGELLHGNLLYRGVMRVPMIAAGSGVPVGVEETAVSTRRVFDTVLAWAGLESEFDLLTPDEEIVMGEAMKPFLQYGWRPQVMAVRGAIKVILSDAIEVYDLRTDPAEAVDLAGSLEVDRAILDAVTSYAVVPSMGGGASAAVLDRESRERLAALGYVGWDSPAPLREDAPAARNMTHLFDDLDRGSALFAHEKYEASIRVFEGVLEEDPMNLMVTVRLAVAHSVLGEEQRAERLFDRAQAIDAGNVDLQHYLAMHRFRFGRWDDAAPLFEAVLRAMPQKLPALEALARIREREGRFDEAARLIERIVVLKESPAADWVRLGELEMAMTDTPGAIRAFEEARRLQGEAFAHDLELGVCYVAARRPVEAAEALDRVPPEHPGYAMALFKRAQVSVLLGEPDRQQKVQLAYRMAEPEIRRMIENEPLFAGLPLR